MRRSSMLLVCVFVGCSGSGSEDSGDGPSIVLEDFQSPQVGPPAQTWKDKASGFQFKTQGEGWSRVPDAELAGFGSDVKLAVRQGARCSGWMAKRPAGSEGARAAADAARAAIGWEGVQVQVDEDVKYDIWTARRYEVQGKRDGRTTSERATWWIDLGTMYAVVGRTDERDYYSRRRCLDAVTAGFALGVASP